MVLSNVPLFVEEGSGLSIVYLYSFARLYNISSVYEFGSVPTSFSQTVDMAGSSHEQDGVRFRRATRSPLGAALWSARLIGAGDWGTQGGRGGRLVHL